jgi:aminoglycoside/choline kinase family phosphotransferase
MKQACTRPKSAPGPDAGLSSAHRPRTRTYLQEISPANAPQLFADATDALIRWQLARSRPSCPLRRSLLRREMQLFPDWYVARHLGVELQREQKERMEQVFALLVKSALAQPKVYVHRDYMPRNLMLSNPIPACWTSRTR